MLKNIWNSIREAFAWQSVGETYHWRYQENQITGQRRVIRIPTLGHSPYDAAWLNYHAQEKYWTLVGNLRDVVYGPKPSDLIEDIES